MDNMKQYYLKMHTLKESLFTVNWTTTMDDEVSIENKRSDYDLSLSESKIKHSGIVKYLKMVFGTAFEFASRQPNPALNQNDNEDCRLIKILGVNLKRTQLAHLFDQFRGTTCTVSINETHNFDFDLALAHLLKNDFDSNDINEIKIKGEMFEI